MSWSKSVFSSVATDVGYDPDTQELTVTWKNGRTSAYSGVPEDVAVNLSNAPSVGQLINGSIKNQFSHRYIR